MTLSSLFWLLGGAILPSLLIAWLMTFVVRRLALRIGLVDRPNARKVHQTPTPLGGGLAIAVAAIVPFLAGSLLLAWVRSGGERIALIPEFAREHLDGVADRMSGLWMILVSGIVLSVLGLIDDWRGVRWQIRLAIQFAVAAVCVFVQGWQLTMFIQLPWLTAGMSIIWIVALINSFNMLDNMDGLSAGVAAIASSFLAAVMLIAPTTHGPQLFVAGFLLVLVGALLGFLIHNRPPAKIFMGDAGSYFVGFCIAIATLLATYASYHSDTPHAVIAPLCVMAVPLYDMTTVILIRLREGRSPFQADKNHFSHRLVELGLSKTQAVLTIYLTTATCGLGALLLHRVDLFGAFVIVLMVACILLLIAILETSARRKLSE